jgi:DNA-nicking Smr family endonuclease
LAKKQDSDIDTRVEDDDEFVLFRQQVSDARPLKHVPRASIPRRAKAQAKFRRDDDREVLRESLEPDLQSAEFAGGEGLRFHRPSVGRRTFRKLARGGYSVQSELDLHGMSAVEASAALREFINDCCLRGLTCVRVIHGKGRGSGSRGPILKRKVDACLRRWEPVLAFVSARQVDGGTGAVYILLNPD